MNNIGDAIDDLDVDINHFNQVYPNLDGLNQSKYYDYDLFNSDCVKSSADFAVYHSNVRSLYPKYSDFLAHLSLLDCTFDALCLTETWLTPASVCMVDINNYNSFHLLRSDGRRAGGVGVYMSDVFKSKRLDNLCFCLDFIECLIIECSRDNRKFIVASIYRPPSSSVELFIDKLGFILSVISGSGYSERYICGDFNLDLINCDNNGEVADFLNLMHSFYLFPLITKTTRNDDTNNSFTLLDNIFVGSPVEYISGIIKSDLSDHYPIFVMHRQIFPNPTLIECRTVNYRMLKDNNILRFGEALGKHNFDDVLACDNINETLIKFNDVVMKYYNLFCPIRSKTLSPKDLLKPWIDSETKINIRKRQRYHLLYKLGKMSKEYYNRFRNFVTCQIRRKEREYFAAKFEEYRGNLRKTWNTINDIISPNKVVSKRSIEKLELNDSIISDPVDIANTLNGYFTSVGRNIAESIQCGATEHLNYMHGNINNLFVFTAVNSSRVEEVIMSLKNKTCNVNNLPTSILKSVVKEISPVMAELINRSLIGGIFPDFLKLSRVIPLPKEGDRADPCNYRPISTVHVFSKVFEKVVYGQLYEFLESNDILFNFQYGFRSGRSTAQAISHYLQSIYDNLDSGSLFFSIFLDFRKAFDCVDHAVLLSKMNFYGIRGRALEWFESYLDGRTQYVSVDGADSNTCDVTHGVPQGSNLGPLLFLIFLNDFPNCSDFFQFTLFADDSTISHTFDRDRIADIHEDINSQLESVHNWLRVNKIHLNVGKTKHMMFSYRGDYQISPIIIGNSQVLPTSSIKFLGIHIDSHLNFSNHVNYLSTKISKSVGILNKLKFTLPSSILKLLYYSLIHPYIYYAIVAWYAAPEYIRNSIFVLQKRAVRCIQGLPVNSHTDSHFKSLSILKVSELYNFNVGIYIYKTINFDDFDCELQQYIVAHLNQHSHDTRNHNKIAVPRYNRSKSQLSLKYVGLSMWNGLDCEVSNSLSLSSFKFKLKRSLVQPVVA